MKRNRGDERSNDMQSRQTFLMAAASLWSLTALDLAASASQAPFVPASENELIAKLDPSVWVSWGKGYFPDPQGATGANKTGFLQVGFQYFTFHLVPYAIVHKSTHFLDGACSIAEFAFEHQHNDGSFDYSESNGSVSSGSVANPAAPASSLTLFFYDLGHSLLVLEKDDWYSNSPECAPYRARINALRPKIAKALDWLMGQQSLLATDQAASNRTLAHGLAYYLVGKSLSRSDAMTVGREIVATALDKVRDGVFPEAGGFDSSYQAINILECEWLAFHVDDDLRDRLWDAIKGGIGRERAAILPTGEASTVGNTRVSASGESYFGHRKSVNGRELMLTFAYYGIMANDPSATELTAKIQKFYHLAIS